MVRIGHDQVCCVGVAAVVGAAISCIVALNTKPPCRHTRTRHLVDKHRIMILASPHGFDIHHRLGSIGQVPQRLR